MRKLFYLLMLSLCTTFASAQTEDEKDGWNMPNGVRFGWQLSNLRQDGDNLGDDLHRGYIGYVRKISIAHFFKVETGLEYMIAGTQLDDDSHLELHYLVLPAQGAVKLGPFVAQAGLAGNFKIAEGYKEDGEKVDRGDKAAFFDLTANAGAGFNFLFMMVEARHYWGLLEVEEESINNDFWQLGLKIHF